MEEKLIFLGIETSCDETAAAVVREKNNGTGEILSNIVSGQVEEHKEFGGIVPELAARNHDFHSPKVPHHTFKKKSQATFS